MGKPTYTLRYPATGDTIPPSKDPGPGGSGGRVYYEINPPPGYDSATRFLGWQEQATSQILNRANWYLANNIDFLYELISPVSIDVGITANDSEEYLPFPVFLGPPGATSNDAETYFNAVNRAFRPIYNINTRVYVSDVRTASGGGGVSAYPSAGIPSTASAKITAVDTINSTITVDTDIGDISYSIMNYDKWLRALRDGDTGNIVGSYATIINKVGSTYTLHANVDSEWKVNDTIYLSNITSKVYARFNTQSPDAGYLFCGLCLPTGLNWGFPVVSLRNAKEQIKEVTRYFPIQTGYPVGSGSNIWTLITSPVYAWQVVTGNSNHSRIQFPVQLPNLCTLKQVDVYYSVDGALTTEGSISLYKRTANEAPTYINGASIPNPNDNWVSITALNETIRNDVYYYFLHIDSGYNTGTTPTHRIYSIRMTFDYDEGNFRP